MGWAYVIHPDTGGRAVVGDDASVLAVLQAKGWERHVMPDVLNPDAPNSAGEVVNPAELDDTEPIISEEEALAKKGKELDAALDAAGLSKSGTADEKRARLAEHQGQLADNTQEEEVSNG